MNTPTNFKETLFQSIHGLSRLFDAFTRSLKAYRQHAFQRKASWCGDHVERLQDHVARQYATNIAHEEEGNSRKKSLNIVKYMLIVWNRYFVFFLQNFGLLLPS